MTEERIPEMEEASFAEMLAQQEDKQTSSNLETGQRVKVKVVAVTSDTVFVSTGSKVDGLVDRIELEQDGVVCNIGDEFELYVVHVSSQEVRLSKVLRGAGGLEALEEAKNARLPVEGKVTGVVKGGFAVSVMRRRAFCPTSQMDLRPIENAEEYVGKTFNFIITKLEQSGRNFVLSRRSLLETKASENLDSFISSVKEGDVLEGQVTRLTPFGAFVEIAPAVEGLVHVSELSWSKNQKPDEVLSPGDKVRVKFLSASKEEKGTKISISIRQITEDPWNGAAERLHTGDVVKGKVIRTADFGAFVEVLPGIEGLIHISELSWEKRVNKASDIVSPGEEVEVKVKEVDTEKRRISLSLRDVSGTPWSTVEQDFPIDSEHTGKLEKRAAFGMFISLAPGITGLMPNSFISQVKGKSRLDKLAPGAEVLVRVAEMNLEARKITLAPAGEDAEVILTEKPATASLASGKPTRDSKTRPPKRERENVGDWKQHAGKAPEGFGSLGDALAAALKKK
jgi:small subunit ribosomal protein S1